MTFKYTPRIASSFLALALSTSLMAQLPADNLKIADKYYTGGDHFSAIQYYEKYLSSLTGNKKDGFDPYSVQPLLKKAGLTENRKSDVLYRIAASYTTLNYPQKAEPYYEQIVTGESSPNPEAQYKYATTLRSLQKFDKAEQVLSNLLKDYTQKDALHAAATKELASLQYIKVQFAKKDLDLYAVNKDALNGSEANYAPVLLNDNDILLTSTRADDGKNDKKNKLYLSASGSLSKIDLPLKYEHIGAASLSKDGQSLYFTAWQVTGGAKLPTIFKANKNGDTWTEPIALPASVNASGFKNQQPFITEDGGTLFFVSNRAGGKGGLDVWSITLDANGEPTGEAKNAGDVINTSQDEQAPYYHTPSKTLVFATNGRVGMGNYDLFYAKGSVSGGWETAENFGYPINSVKDDIYFVSKAKNENILESVLLSSDRNADCCLELYAVSKKTPVPPPPPVAKVEEPKVEEPVVETGIAKVLDNVYFEYDRYKLLDGSEASLNEIVTLMKAKPEIKVEIGGHTDNKGSNAYNQRLSQQRAQSCVDYIVSQGIDASRITAKGYGSSKPVAPNTLPDGKDNPDGRAKNRRTEFTVL